MKKIRIIASLALMVFLAVGCDPGSIVGGASAPDGDGGRAVSTPSSGLKAQWIFDTWAANQSQGRTYLWDVSWHSNNAELVGTQLPLADGWSGQALPANGGQYAVAADRDSLDFGTGDFSIACWIKPTSVSGLQSILDKRTSSGGYHVCQNEGQIIVQLADSSGYTNYGSGTSPFALRADQWYNLIVTVDRDHSSGLRIFIDGCLFTTQNPTGRRGSLSNGANLLIGKHKDYANNAFYGRIDDLRLYNRALSSGEVQQMTAAGVPAYSASYWNADTVRLNNNCYNYAANKRTDTFAQLGLYSGYIAYYNLDYINPRNLELIYGGTLPEKLAYVKNAAIADGLEFIGENGWSPGQAAPPGKAIVALVFSDNSDGEYSDDYHFYRLNSDNQTWSHKIAQGEAINYDMPDLDNPANQRTIYDPRTCNRGPYLQFIGFFRVWSDSRQGHGHENIR